jgi:hypothetical protein
MGLDSSIGAWLTCAGVIVIVLFTHNVVRGLQGPKPELDTIVPLKRDVSIVEPTLEVHCLGDGQACTRDR